MIEAVIPQSIELTVATIKFLAAKAEPKVREQINKWKTAQQAEKLRANIRQIGNINTIASKQSSTIDEIYFPAKIIGPKSFSKTIVHASELFAGKSRIALIIGTAGQGKSVFLRYLCIQDLDLYGNIPLFVELRRISEGKNLRTLLIEQLKTLGLGDVEPEATLNILLNSGKSRIFLDGYDEISREYSLQVKIEINQLLSQHEKLEVLVTSRPGAISQHLKDSFDITQHDIAPIPATDHDAFFRKIGVDLETKVRLIEAISRSKAEIKGLLSTPLMLTLLVITCGRQQDLPDSLPEFYDSLFNVLSSTHDGTKPGYTRQKATSLSNSDLERLFSAFCFVSKSQFKRNSLTTRQFEETLEKSKEITNTRCTTEGFRTDITETVCIMLNDGLETAFIHKSIQEYYAARFIHTLENKTHAEKILKRIEENGLFEWNNELQFLEDFRDRVYENTIGIPHANSLISEIRLKSRKNQVSWSKLKKQISQLKISVGRYRASKEVSNISYQFTLQANSANRYSVNIASILSTTTLRAFPPSGKPPSLSDRLEVVQLSDLAEQTDALKLALVNAASKFCDELYKKSQTMIERQNRQDAGVLSILD
jgi:predicted NACHT family NTPase